MQFDADTALWGLQSCRWCLSLAFYLIMSNENLILNTFFSCPLFHLFNSVHLCTLYKYETRQWRHHSKEMVRLWLACHNHHCGGMALQFCDVCILLFTVTGPILPALLVLLKWCSVLLHSDCLFRALLTCVPPQLHRHRWNGFAWGRTSLISVPAILWVLPATGLTGCSMFWGPRT